MTLPGWDAAFEAFDGNDVGVRDALGHTDLELPHLELLALRRSPSHEHVAEARGLLGASRSAWLHEAFVAAPLERLGDVAGALVARLALLPLAPRWEGWAASHVLTRIAANALTIGAAPEAERAARRALTFVPFEPAAVAALAEALLARGESEEARELRASLWDAPYGPEVIAGEPTDEDRAASTALRAKDLEELAPLGMHDAARFAVFSLHDPTLVETLSGVLRHAAILLRLRCAPHAWATLAAHARWAPGPSTVLQWLGVEGDTDRRDRHRLVMERALSGHHEVAVACAEVLGQRPSLASVATAARIQAVEQLPPEQIVSGLLDFHLGVRVAACHRLADHPITAFAIAEEAGFAARLYGEPASEVPAEAHSLAAAWAPGARPGLAPSATPLAKAIRQGLSGEAEATRMSAFIEHAAETKPACKACKTPFHVSEPQLRVLRDQDALSQGATYHLRCAGQGKTKALLAEATRRWRGPLAAG